MECSACCYCCAQATGVHGLCHDMPRRGAGQPFNCGPFTHQGPAGYTSQPPFQHCCCSSDMTYRRAAALTDVPPLLPPLPLLLLCACADWRWLCSGAVLPRDVGQLPGWRDTSGPGYLHFLGYAQGTCAKAPVLRQQQQFFLLTATHLSWHTWQYSRAFISHPAGKITLHWAWGASGVCTAE